MIVACVGRVGSGKTLLAVSEGLIQYRRGVKIYSNFNLEFADKISSYEELYSVGTMREDKLIILDEGHLWFGNVKSSEFPQYVLSVFAQNRKMKNDIFLTVQSINRLSKFVRELIDLVVIPRIIRIYKWWFVIAKSYDVSDLNELGNRVKKNSRAEKIIIRNVTDAVDLYDTFELVELPLEMRQSIHFRCRYGLNSSGMQSPVEITKPL